MSIPSTQKALQLEKPAGDPKRGQRNVAAVRYVPVPKPQTGMVLVKAMLGAYPGLLYKNSTFACNGAGVIVQGGLPDSAKGHPDGIVILVPTRGWESDPEGPEAELPNAKNKQNKLESDHLVAAPKHLDVVHSAALPYGGITAFRALFTKGQLKAGQILLLTGVGGGVAQLALQFAVAADANVYVTGGSQAKVDRAVKNLGAKRGAVSKDKDCPKQISKQLPSGKLYIDIVVDSAGGAISGQAMQAGLKVGGKLVCFSMTADPKNPFTMREVLKNVDVLGSTMGSKEEFRECIRFVEKHKLVPTIDTILEGLENAHKGFPLLQDADKRSGGKVIIRVAPADKRTSKL
ncbi:NAD(P)-binding protein [Tilletiaria anomala UBC 951]|uniref:NAD(P)-binding protein n=1 Tax=Tilletiaria anomala (strain ATCC 24038 / CBS 436.72 / UBC 951) TaxID=1037660 RepID=A0A066WRC7_TILAU|nr:NAD(P)-binding protein [Tilletiaria anomala UBC 951]KDN53559.1 NAD(P)-binding protein [Tilletiaria anomala UBC 951]